MMALKVVVEADGGSRGNPGPAGYGSVVWTADRSTVLAESKQAIGHATNNVAEYRGLLRGLERARAVGATEIEIVNDSELVARQLTGAYKVKHPAMKQLHAEAMVALAAFDGWSIRSVPRAENARADELVNAALDAQ